MEGLLVGVVLNYWFSYFVNIGLVSKHIGYHWFKQLMDILPIMLISLFAALISYSMGRHLQFGLYLNGIITFFVFTLIYIGWSFLFKPESYTYFLTVIPARFKFAGRDIKRNQRS